MGPAAFDPRYMNALQTRQLAAHDEELLREHTARMAEHEEEIRRREERRIDDMRRLERERAERRIQALMPTEACTEHGDCRW
jgi:ElaB/YqjD/DUF883 family membrane-anchored ribosome-binding protein